MIQSADYVWVDKANSVADSINKSGGQAIAVAGDILSDDYINDLVKKAADFGGGKIHIIVNNAGFTWDGVIHKVCSGNLLNSLRQLTPKVDY